MAILVDKSTKVICQGFTGSQGTFPYPAGDRVQRADRGPWGEEGGL